MSGGSFNYLYAKAPDELLQLPPELREMAEELEGMGYAAKPAAEATRELVELCRQTVSEIERRTIHLADVWKAVEWWRSCDSSKDGAYVAIGRFVEAEKAREGTA